MTSDGGLFGALRARGALVRTSACAGVPLANRAFAIDDEALGQEAQ